MTDDIDGSEATQTVDFGYRGKRYSIDLNDAHAEELDRFLAPYIAAGTPGDAPTRSGGPGGSRARGATGQGASVADPRSVRAWAEANGVAVPARGRIPGRVLEQYRAGSG